MKITKMGSILSSIIPCKYSW